MCGRELLWAESRAIVTRPMFARRGGNTEAVVCARVGSEGSEPESEVDMVQDHADSSESLTRHRGFHGLSVDTLESLTWIPMCLG